MAYGITDQGFVRPRLVDIQTEINNILIATFGATIDLSASSVFTQFSGIMAERLDLVWQGMEDVYNSQYPDTAFGASLDNVGAISGILRLGALASVANAVRLFGTPGTLVPAGTQFSVQNSPTSVFSTQNDVTLVAGQDSIQRITYSAVPTGGSWKLTFGGHSTGSLAYNITAAALQTAIRALQFGVGANVTGDFTAGFTVDFAGVSGLQIQPTLIVSANTLVISSTPITTAVTILQAGANQADVNAVALTTGPTIANAGTLTVIATPVAGLSSILNVTDATVGRNVESDNTYRARRAQTLQIAGAGTVDAIRARLLELVGVTAVIVFENITEITDVNGRPAKSFEAIVQGGLDQAIADLIWSVKPAGIRTDGTVPMNVTDSQGQIHEVRFSRPTAVPIYVKLTLTINMNFPATGVSGATQAILAAGNALGIGKEVVTIPYLICSISDIPGIENAVLWISKNPSPTSPANIAIAANELSVFDSSRIEIITV